MRVTCRFIVVVSILFFALGGLLVHAHDNVKVHPALTAKAWDIVPQRLSILNDFGVSEVDALTYRRSGASTDTPATISDWLVNGSVDEDAPEKRCLGHFYNPLAAIHSLTIPPVVAPDSFQWATSGWSIYSPFSPNEEDWRSTRGYYYDALTNSSKTERLKETAHTFYALGKIVHLLQDLSQPEHVRNDAHMINGETTPIVGAMWGVVPKARWIENYGEVKGPKIINDLSVPGNLAPLDWRSAGFKSIEDFWNRKKYTDGSQLSLDALNADASGSITATLGLSEFANGNFLGADASYKEVTAGLLNFPHPAITDTNCSEDVSLVQLAGAMKSVTSLTPGQEQAGKPIFLSKTTAGIPVTHHSMLTYTGFKTIQRGGNLGSTTQNRLPAVTINSASVLQEYHEILLKKAVEYSAGLLDYFFRGKLSADCYFDETSGKYHLLVSNVSGQPFHGGSFEVYFDDAAGNRTKYTGVTDDYSPQGDTRTLESGYGVEGYGEWFQYGYYSWYEDLWFPCVRIEIPVPNSAAGLAATKAIVVYKDGIIGGKKTDGTAEDSVDEGKAVAALYFDLPMIVAPIPGVEVASRSAGMNKVGYSAYCHGVMGYGYLCNDYRVFRQVTLGGGVTHPVNDTCSITFSVSGYIRIAADGSVEEDTTSGTYDASCYGSGSCSGKARLASFGRAPTGFDVYNPTVPCNIWVAPNYMWSDTNGLVSTESGYNGSSGSTTATVSDEYSTASLISNTVAALPIYSSFGSGTGSSFRFVNYTEQSCTIRDSKYRFRFNPGAVPAGLGYRISWLERFLPALTYNANNQITGGGAALSRVDVVNGGAGYATATVDSYMDGAGGVVVYINDGGNGYAVAPTVALPAPQDPNGTQATAHAVVSNGTVTEIIMDNSGSGYTVAPVLTLAAPTGSANPVIVVSAPGNGGTQATATATLNAAGQIQSISLNASGSRYTGTPYVYVSSSPNGLGQGATFAVHLGTETEKTSTWSGPVPGDYSAADSSTWPVIGPYDLAVPVTNGTTTVENVKAEITAGP